MGMITPTSPRGCEADIKPHPTCQSPGQCSALQTCPDSDRFSLLHWDCLGPASSVRRPPPHWAASSPVPLRACSCAAARGSFCQILAQLRSARCSGPSAEPASLREPVSGCCLWAPAPAAFLLFRDVVVPSYRRTFAQATPSLYICLTRPLTSFKSLLNVTFQRGAPRPLYEKQKLS